MHIINSIKNVNFLPHPTVQQIDIAKLRHGEAQVVWTLAICIPPMNAKICVVAAVHPEAGVDHDCQSIVRYARQNVETLLHLPSYGRQRSSIGLRVLYGIAIFYHRFTLDLLYVIWRSFCQEISDIWVIF